MSCGIRTGVHSPSLLTDPSVVERVVVLADHLRPPQPRRRVLDHLRGLAVRDELVENDDPRFEAHDLDLSRPVPVRSDFLKFRVLHICSSISLFVVQA